MATAAQAQIARTTRIAYLDVLRNYLMLLGVVIHAAQLFRTHSADIVHLGPGNQFYDYVITAIHMFRLPGFFLISGFVGGVVLRARGARFFVGRRVVRLGIPFVVTLLTLNMLEIMLEASFTGRLHAGTSAEFRAFLVESLQQGNLRHLWFLPTLMIYSAAVIAINNAVERWIRTGSGTRIMLAVEKSDAYVLLLPLAMVVADAAAWRLQSAWEHVRWTQLPNPDALHYFLFFLFGYFAQRMPAVWLRFGSTTRWYAMATGGLLVTMVLSQAHSVRIASYSRMALENFGAWVLVALTIRVGRRFLDGVPPKLLGNTDVAYSVYLVHHIIVIGLAVLLVNVALPNGVRFIAIAGITAALSIAAAYVIMRVPVLRFAFNGRPLRA